MEPTQSASSTAKLSNSFPSLTLCLTRLARMVSSSIVPASSSPWKTQQFSSQQQQHTDRYTSMSCKLSQRICQSDLSLDLCFDLLHFPPAFLILPPDKGSVMNHGSAVHSPHYLYDCSEHCHPNYDVNCRE